MIAESIHDLIPPDEIHPIIEKVIDQYISEQVDNQVITIAINAIWEICLRQPAGITEAQLHHIVNFWLYKDKSVAMATKSLVNLFRDINPALLESKDRGKMETLEMK